MDLFKFDLKSGYHHLDVFPPHQAYLGFSWIIDGELKYFGLTSSPYIFTELLRPLVKFWRFNGLLIVIYMDDGIYISVTLQEARRSSKFIRQSLIKAGFVPNPEKCTWEPTESSEWLGLLLDTHAGELKIPTRRIESLLSRVENVFQSYPFSTPRKLASVTGKIISMSPVLGSGVSHLMSRHMYYTIESRLTWDEVINVNDPELLRELKFWLENVFRLNCKKIFTSQIPKIISSSDASDTGCGSTLSVGNQICHMTWNTLEKTKSSTWRELTAIKFGILSFLPLISNKSLYWFSGNQAAVDIVTNGSRKKHLQYLALGIFKLCLLNSISIILPLDTSVPKRIRGFYK